LRGIAPVSRAIETNNDKCEEDFMAQEIRSSNPSGQSNQKHFRCADVGHKECNWEVSGKSEDEIMPQIEQHGRERHNVTNFDNESRNRVRNAIRDRAA
jgi:predicted small metal-binding protein